MTEQSVEEVLAEAAAAVEASSQKKERKPKTEKAAKEPKSPKAPKLYPQWNEDGTPLLGEDGQQVMAETKMKKPRAASSGARGPRTSISDTQTLHKTEKGAGTVFKGKRGDNFAAITDGMTAKDYFDANGGRGVVGTFLIWYVKEGLVEVRGE